MNPEKELIFAYLEEDNVQRAYFRARPLMTVYGDIQEEAQQRWPNDGCLRIVPDRNEQHTFKERMRALGNYCLLDLTGFSPEANKIRTNKNYRPEGNEPNQYILYSDAVSELPPRVFYEILEGNAEDYAQLSSKAITPCFFIRKEDTLFGPVQKDALSQPEAAKEMSGTLFALSFPDGQVHTMLCVEAENVITQRPSPAMKMVSVAQPQPKEAEEAPIQPHAIPVGQKLNILNLEMSFEETLQDIAQPLSSKANLLQPKPFNAVQPPKPFAQPVRDLHGTPLVRTSFSTSSPQPKNRVQEVIASQIQIVRNDPPAEPLPNGVAMDPVVNPIDTACQAFRAGWQHEDSRAQLVRFLFSLDSMKHQLLNSDLGQKTPLYQAIQQQLQELEAERLTALVELTKAKANEDAFRQQCIEQASQKAKAQLDKLTTEKEALETVIEQLQTQQNLLIAQRDALCAQIDQLKTTAIPEQLVSLLSDCGFAPDHSSLLRLSPVTGRHITTEQLLHRVYQLEEKCGLTPDRNRIIAFLTLLAICSRIGLVSDAPSAVVTLAQNLVHTLGWENGFAHQVDDRQKVLVTLPVADAAPSLLLTSLPRFAPLSGVCKLTLAKTTRQLTSNPAYEATQWPIFPFSDLPFVPQITEGLCPTVSSASLQTLLTDTVECTVAETALKPILSVLPALAGQAYNEMLRFTAACASTMDGGLTAACDWAIVLWVLPSIAEKPALVEAVKPLLAEYPLSLSILGGC